MGAKMVRSGGGMGQREVRGKNGTRRGVMEKRVGGWDKERGENETGEEVYFVANNIAHCVAGMIYVF